MKTLSFKKDEVIKLPSIQISKKLYDHICEHRIKLIVAHKNPNVSFNTALEDMIKKLQDGKIEKPKNKKAK